MSATSVVVGVAIVNRIRHSNQDMAVIAIMIIVVGWL